jgi:hypothetical protein
VEDGLLGLDEGLEDVGFLVLDALLVDLEVDVVDDLGDDLAGVLQADGEVVLARFLGEELDKVDGVFFCQTKTVVVVLGGLLVNEMR